ncbi:MAG: class I poly(R)-hydroxyalkanoic acid synthase [Bacteroidota bacterium]|nr:class I poly(R)-hydroxyalkanoic acid synthase [Bacteroidota bacterium]
MFETIEFSYTNFINGLTKATNKVVSNYFENASGYHHDNRDIANAYFNFFSKIYINPGEIYKIQNSYLDFLTEQQKAWKNALTISLENTSDIQKSNSKEDKRFIAKEWSQYPYFNFIKQNYLLLEKFSKKIIEDVDFDTKAKKKLEFYNSQYMDLLSPSNFLFTNPEVLKLANETNGKSLWDGFTNLIADIEKGRIAQVDELAFKVGENLATTPGAVVFENELIQLIQYSPSKSQVYEIPLLIIPPWINKYYILDLQPKNSFVKFFVDLGVTVFIVSWKNPNSTLGHLTFDDYVCEGALKAIDVTKEISSSKKINTLGYCLGGTLLSIASAILADDTINNPILSATFLATMIDFSNIGPMGDVIDEALIKKLERGELLKGGLLHGHDMERAFNLIRANDLIWSYAVNNYLKGLKPTAFDVIYWTNDNTNLPANMYKYYMRQMIFENKLSRKNALKLCNTPIDIGKINFPVFVIGMTEDYISPAKTAFITTELVSGPVEFILGGSGHVMGAINPPSKNKYGYYIDGQLGKGFKEWKKTAKFNEGSWWTPWSEKLIKISGKKIPAKEQLGNKTHKILESAPGKYVLEKS